MKIARLKGYAPIWIVGSRSDGLGFKGAGSNCGRCKRIWRSRAKRGAGAAAEGAGGVLPRRRSAGEGETGIPELETGCRLAWEGASGTRKLPMGLLGF